MSSITKQWEQFLSPEIMLEKLISASLYITAFELLKESIVGRIRSFYMVEFDENDELSDQEYKAKVLTKDTKRRPLDASINWLIENGAIDEEDRQIFEKITKTRNSLAHRLPSMVLEDQDFQHPERFFELLTLLRKIEIWWVVNIDIPTNPDFDGREIEEKDIVPGSVLIIQMMLEIISGNEAFLKHHQKMGSHKASKA